VVGDWERTKRLNRTPSIVAVQWTSKPNGLTEWSERDRQQGGEEPFQTCKRRHF